MKTVLDNIMEKAENADMVVIIGAGTRGTELLSYLEEKSITVAFFFDNRDKLAGKKIHGVEIVKPYRVVGGGKCLYIIAVDNLVYRDELFTQLVDMGITEDDIVVFNCYWNYDFISQLDKKDYKKQLEKRYYKVFGREIDWENPVTYNEKINCDKLICGDEFRTKLVDKYRVREWVKEKVGDKYLTKLYGVWDDEEKINFDDLPESFVLKVNNGSGRNIIVKDKSAIDQKMVRRQLRELKEKNFAFVSLELQYKDIVPKIICEEYLEGVAENIYDYNIYCFHGEPKYIWCIKGSHRPGCKASFYDKDWVRQPFSYGYPKDEEIAPKPQKLEEMLALSKELCKDFKHVRVDLYNLPDGRILFGEMTLTTWSGLRKFIPDEYDSFFGSLI